MFTESQQRTIAGGVQAHSMGDIYPLCVVGLHVNGLLRYGVKDLSTGLYVGPPPDSRSSPPGYMRQWFRAEEAKRFAEHIKDYENTWVKAEERTTVNYLGVTVIVAKRPAPQPTQQVKDFAFRAYQEERQLGRPLTPYEEYQLAVAVENGD